MKFPLRLGINGKLFLRTITHGQVWETFAALYIFIPFVGSWKWPAAGMTPYFVTIFLLCLLSLATAANFNLVYEWPDKWDCECPSEANSTKVLSIESANPVCIDPQFMAVYGSRIFFILEKHVGIPVSLVTLPTSSASPAPPKLTPFPSWEMHGNDGDCDKIESSRGLEVDSVGKLWVLDNGSDKCNNSKIWSIDLANKDQTKLIHRFPFYGHLNDLVLDETPNGTFAYISRWFEQNIVVFSLERNQSWTVHTPRIDVSSIALSPKDQEPRQLYFGGWNSNGLYSISVAVLRNGTRTANPKLIGNWTSSQSYRMVMDKHGTLYSAFFYKDYVHSWNTSQPFLEQRFFEVAGLNTNTPFTIASDQNETLWMTVFDNKKKPRYRLLKASGTAKSFEVLSVTPAPPSPTTPAEMQENSFLTEKLHHHQLINVILICSIVFTVILFWFILRKKRNDNSLSPNTIEALQITFFSNNPVEYNEFQNDAI